MSSTAIALPAQADLYQRLILKLLANMQLGSCCITLPDGQALVLGNGKSDIQASIRINNPYFFKRCVLYGDIGFGEGYMDGDWDTDDITSVLKWFLLNVENAPSMSGSTIKSWTVNLLKWFNQLSHLKRANHLAGSKKNIAEHYDLNNDFFALFLDPTMTYSSAYFVQDGLSLQAAQIAKYERLCRQLHLRASDHVLEIGSGWGGNAIYMAGTYGCKVTTVTISEEQYKLARERIIAAGLEDKITILLQDYRLINGRFDKIVSIEMLEAVGAQYLDVYFKQCHRLLTKDGILALQVITCPDARFDALRKGVDWIQKHIFPGSLLPSVGAINKAVNNTSDLTLVDVKDLGLDYAQTLHAWKVQFNLALQQVRQQGFSETFIRKWNYYLSYCEAAFAMRNINVLQMVYVRPNNTNR